MKVGLGVQEEDPGSCRSQVLLFWCVFIGRTDWRFCVRNKIDGNHFRVIIIIKRIPK
jgi:hypothetical protein